MEYFHVASGEVVIYLRNLPLETHGMSPIATVWCLLTLLLHSAHAFDPFGKLEQPGHMAT
jgi:hypothetical protein